MGRGEKAENMHSGAAKVAALVMKAFESSLLVSCISSVKYEQSLISWSGMKVLDS